jgi:hypothetical protein
VFVQSGGALTIEGGSLTGGTATGGTGGTAGGKNAVAGDAGSGLGAGVFLQGNETLTLGAPAGQTQTIGDAIADMGGKGGSAGIVVNGPGAVYADAGLGITGGITIDQGDLQIGYGVSAEPGGGYTFNGVGTLDIIQTAPKPASGAEDYIQGVPFQSSFSHVSVGDTIVLEGVTAADATPNQLDYDFRTGTGSLPFELPLSLNPGVEALVPTEVYPDPAAPLDSETFDYVFTAISNGMPCFLAGTAIATPGGARPVEHLAPGDRVTLAGGGTRPVVWIGHRRIDLARHPDPAGLRPVRILAGAFADGIPARDLLLSPDHAVFIDGALIPVRLLRNGASIIEDASLSVITYFHVELDAHAILLAEGLPAESYLDTGNRDGFAGGDAPLRLHPDFGGQAGRAAKSCAPLLTDPGAVEPVWQRLATRAGITPPPDAASTDDPDLHIWLNGRRLPPIGQQAGRFLFALPAAPAGARLVSRAAVPNDGRPWIDDRRRLGVRVNRLVLRAGRRHTRDQPGRSRAAHRLVGA